jgi:calcyclin binding protein
MAATHPRATALLQKALEEVKTEGVANGTTPKGVASTAVPQATPTAAPAVRAERTTYATKISQYGWDQTSKAVKIYITSISDLSKASKDDVRAKFKNKSFEVEVKTPKGRVYSLVINDLFEPIVPEDSFVKLKSGTVIVTLKKSVTKDWTCLTATEKKLKDAREPKTPKTDKNEDPGASLMGLMKQMYQDGDDEMKRTIAKAWHDSQEKRTKEPELPA